MPIEALLFKSSGRLFHILRSSYEGRYSIMSLYSESQFDSQEISPNFRVFKSVVK